MAYDWFRVDATFAEHPKTFSLAERLQEPNAGMYIVRLWCWLTRFSPRGRFTQQLSGAVERACAWRGETGKLIEAFRSSGWLDSPEDGVFEFHDWWDKQGAMVEKAEKDAARKRLSRKKTRRAPGARPSADSPRTKKSLALVQETEPGAGTLQERTDTTGENRTEQDRRGQEHAANGAAPPSLEKFSSSSVGDNHGIAFWYAFQARRKSLGLAVESPPAADRESLRELGSWFLAMQEKLPSVDRAVERFFDSTQNEYWKRRGFPFAAFKKQWFEFDGRNDDRPARPSYPKVNGSGGPS